MDEFVGKTLQDWNLQCLNDIFEENMVDEEAFYLLDEETIKEMIPAVGPRKKFLKRFQELNGQMDQVNVGPLAEKRPSEPQSTCAATSDQRSEDPSLPNDLASQMTDSNSSASSGLRQGSSGIANIASRTTNDFKIRSILESRGVDGICILEQLDRGYLNRKMRLKMVQILVALMIEKFGDRPKADIKIAMAKAVVTEFPFMHDDEGQGFEAWYTPGKGKHSATGWLEERLRNVRKRTNTPTRLTSSSTTPQKIPKVTLTLPECNISEADCEGMKEWLKNNVEPVAQVKNYMEKTALKRAKWIRENPQLQLPEIQLEYPRLFDTPCMVDIDFRAIYSDVSNNFFLKFTPTFAEKLLQYADLQGGKWKSYIQKGVENLESDEQKTNIAIQLLPCIFPTGRCKKKRCSIDEALKTFIDVQPVGTNIPRYIETTPPSPFILILGERRQPHQTFVVIGGIIQETPNLLKAVDVAFKMFYILDLEYPWQCAITWEFIQKVVYIMDTNKCKKSITSPAVVALRAALK